MAKRRKKTRTHRRRRVSGLGVDLQSILFGAAGAVGAKMLAAKLMPTMNSKIKSAALIALGAFLAKKPQFRALGTGVAIGGAVQLATDFGIVSGIGGLGATPIVFRQGLNGTPMMQVPEISGVGNPQGSPELSLISGIGCDNDPLYNIGVAGLYDNYS
jgi:hypothetical protein